MTETKHALFMCILPYFNYGGAATLFYRMLIWARNNHYESLLVTQRNEGFEEEWIETLKINGIKLVFYKEKPGGYDFYDMDGKKKYIWAEKSPVICIVSDMFEHFAAAECKKRMNCSDFRLYFYIIHPFTSNYTNIRIINKIYHRALLEKLFCSGNLIFMDEEIRDYYLKRRNEVVSKKAGDKSRKDCRIIRLGMDIKPWNEQQIISKQDSGIFNIMSICRMDFPFKGYVLGLVEAFSKLCRQYKNIKLYIVGDGDDMGMLKAKIERCSPDVRDNIVLLGNIPYTELDGYLKTAHILVGMGTTLLDGAGNGVPGLIASSYQTSDYACGMFHKIPNVLGYVLGEEGSRETTLYQELCNMLNLSDSEYRNICRKTYEEYKKNYDINETMKELIEIQGTYVDFSFLEKEFFKFIRLLVNVKLSFRKKRMKGR